MVGASTVAEGIAAVDVGGVATPKPCLDDVSALIFTLWVPCTFSGLRLKCNPGTSDETLGSIRADETRCDLFVSCLPSLSVSLNNCVGCGVDC